MPRRVTWFAAAAALFAAPSLAQTPPPAPASRKPPPAKTQPKTVEGVVVTGQGAELRTDIDRRSYDVTKDLSATTGSIAEALRNIPSVDVDVNGAVSLRGDPNVTIMIDGKPTSQFKGAGGGLALQGLPANQIERVEVITNPSAAYSPEGSAGIINLITRKTRRAGPSASIRANLGTAGRRNFGGAASYVGDKLTLSADAAARHDPQHSTTEDARSEIDPAAGVPSVSHRFDSRKGPLDLWNARLGLDYDLDTETRLSAEVRASDLTFDYLSTQPTLETGPGGLVLQDTFQTGVFRQDRGNTAGALSARHNFGDDHELTASLSRELTRDKDAERLANSYAVPVQPDVYKDIRQQDALGQTEFKIDYVRPMPAEGKLKTGYDLRFIDNRYDADTLRGTTAADAAFDPAGRDRFRYRQRLGAAYVTYEQPFGDLTAQAGLRFEDERLDLDQLTLGIHRRRDTPRLFPTLHLAWRLTDTQQLTASYSERVQRPTPEDLNPFRAVEVFVATEGNPDLKPQITHAYELGWQRKSGGTTWLATLYYRRNENGVTNVITDIGDHVLLIAKANLTRSQNAGLELVANGKLGKALSYNLSSNLYWTEIDAANLGLAGVQPQRSSFALGGRASLNWQATARDIVQLSVQTTPKLLLPQGFREPMALLFLGYRHRFSEALSGVITAQDPFDTYRSVQVIDTPALRERTVNRARIQAAFIGLTWSFGAASKRPQSFDFGG